MVRKPNTGLTEGEERIMSVLWNCEEASVREVTDALSTEKPATYNTVLTMMKILHDKGVIAYRQEGRAFIYHATLSQDKARSNALQRIIGALFNGSPEALAAHLVKESELDHEALAAIRKELDAPADTNDTEGDK
jgi:BlaI family penicillinase repressor